MVLTLNLESRKDGDIRIHLNNLPTPGQQDDKVIMFFKKKPDIITPENMHKVKDKRKLFSITLFRRNWIFRTSLSPV